MTWHVTPVNDLQEHEESSTCKCNPTMKELENGDMMFTHNSYDGREFLERLVEDENICKN